MAFDKTAFGNGLISLMGYAPGNLCLFCSLGKGRWSRICVIAVIASIGASVTAVRE